MQSAEQAIENQYDKQELAEQELEPILERLANLCTELGAPMIFVAQCSMDERGSGIIGKMNAKESTSRRYNPDMRVLAHAAHHVEQIMTVMSAMLDVVIGKMEPSYETEHFQVDQDRVTEIMDTMEQAENLCRENSMPYYTMVGVENGSDSGYVALRRSFLPEGVANTTFELMEIVCMNGVERACCELISEPTMLSELILGDKVTGGIIKDHIGKYLARHE